MTTDCQSLIATTPKLIKAGAPTPPWWGDDAWCDLRENYVLDDDAPYLDKPMSYVYCPPAVAAAVVWYAGELCQLGMDKGWWEYMSFGPRVGGNVGWYWMYGDDEEFPAKSEIVYTQLEAATALILAVADAIGDDDEA